MVSSVQLLGEEKSPGKAPPTSIVRTPRGNFYSARKEGNEQTLGGKRTVLEQQLSAVSSFPNLLQRIKLIFKAFSRFKIVYF